MAHCILDFYKKFKEPIMNRKVFSLIELLVVVAIIGILASMMLPSLGEARERAKIATCLNNMKQMGFSNAMYLDDSEGYYPIANAATGFGWDDLLSSYDGRNLTDAQIKSGAGVNGRWGARKTDLPGGADHAPMYRCPLDDRDNGNFILKTYCPTQLSGINLNTGTGHNFTKGIYGYSNTNGIEAYSRNISALDNTSGIITHAENLAPFSNPGNNNIRLRLGSDWTWSGITATIFSLNEDKHSDLKYNFLMADGHVKKMTAIQSLVKNDGSLASTGNVSGSSWDSLR